MATESLSPVPKLQFFDNNGMPLVGGKLFTYSAGSSTKRATYVDSAGVTPNSNPIILDFRGEAQVWIPPNVAYKYVLARSADTDPPGSPIWSVDNIVNSQLTTLYGGVDTGTANAYILTFVSNFSAYADGIIIYWIPGFTNTGGSTLNVNGLGIVPIVSSNGSALQGGEIVANQTVGVIYRLGSFYLLSDFVASGSFTGTLTGMTTTVTGTFSYKISNGIASIYATGGAVGTSNTTAMNMTGAPAVLFGNPVGPGRLVPCVVSDNSVSKLGYVQTQPSTLTLAFQLMAVSGTAVLPNGAFTNAGVKGLLSTWQITYPI